MTHTVSSRRHSSTWKLVAALAALHLLAMLSLRGAGGAEGPTAAAFDSLASRMPEMRTLYEFDKWSDRVKLAGKDLVALPDFSAALGRHGSVKAFPGSGSASYMLVPRGMEKGGTDATVSLCNSALEAKEALLRHFATATRPGRIAVMAEAGSAYDVGDVCLVPDYGEPRRLNCTRNNVYFRVSGSERVDPTIILAVAKAIDAELVRALEAGEPAGPAPQLPAVQAQEGEARDLPALAAAARSGARAERREALAVLAETPEGRQVIIALIGELKGAARADAMAALSKVGTPDALNALKKIADTTQDAKLSEEAMEALLKGMSPQDARKYALEQAEKLAANPDAEPEKLRFFMKGLRQDEDPPQVRLLRQILRKAKNEQVRTDCLRLLSNWITDASEVREDVLRILKERAQDESPRVREAIARALGESGDVRLLPVLAGMLDDGDASVRRQAAEAACRLLGWECAIPPGEKEAEAWLADLRERLKPILEALSKFDEAAAAQLPPASAPATPEK